MTGMQIFFLIVGLVILGSALMVVTTRNLIHAAMWLIVTLFGVAVLYAILNASFLAVVQVVVYIGAIAILFIFAVMLTRKECATAVAIEQWLVVECHHRLADLRRAVLDASELERRSKTQADFPPDMMLWGSWARP